MRMLLGGLVALVLSATSAYGQAANSIDWDANYPKGGIQEVKVKGTFVTKPGWTCVSVIVVVVNQATNQLVTQYNGPTPLTSPWGEWTISCPGPGGAGYLANVTVVGVFVNGAGSESKTKSSSVTVR